MITYNDWDVTHRYWVTCWGTIVREWTKEEYENYDPKKKIYEDLMWDKCECCGRFLDTVWQETDWDKRGKSVTRKFCSTCYNKTFRRIKNKGYAIVPTEMHCVEFGRRKFGDGVTDYYYVYKEG